MNSKRGTEGLEFGDSRDTDACYFIQEEMPRKQELSTSSYSCQSWPSTWRDGVPGAKGQCCDVLAKLWFTLPLFTELQGRLSSLHPVCVPPTESSLLLCPAFDSAFPDRVEFWHGWNPCDIASTLPDLQIPFLGGGHELCPHTGLQASRRREMQTPLRLGTRKPVSLGAR